MKEDINVDFYSGKMKEKIINYLIKIFFWLGISLIFPVLITDHWKLNSGNVAAFIAIVILILPYVFKSRFSTGSKIFVIFFVILIVLIQGFYNKGIYTPTKILIVTTTVFLSYFLSKKQSYYVLFSYMGVYAFFAYLYLNKNLDYPVNTHEVESSAIMWFFRGLLIFGISIAMINITAYYNKVVAANFSIIEQKNTELDQYKENLENIVRDRTKELEDSLSREKELGVLKTNFISMASHEYRTPLTSIQATVDLILDYSDRFTKEQIEDRLVKITEQVNTMTILLEDVLIIGKEEVNKLEFRPVRINLVDLVKETIIGYQLSHKDERNVVYHFTSDVIMYDVDVKRMKQIVTNLFSNALKYSEFPSIIEISISEEKESIVLSVSDKGIGISERDQNSLFEPFYRGENVGEVLGSGLGLSILEKAVSLHNGKIKIISEIDKGTSFRITFPS